MPMTTKIILDETLRSRLNNLTEQVELCDEAGKTLAHCLPLELYNKMMCGWVNAQVDDDEVEGLRRQRGGRPLAEIWKTLEGA
jgi:hypothetical protein